jgi:uncharacterized membrane protein YfcA
MALAFLAREGLVNALDFRRFLLFVPALLLGQWLGARSFKSSDPTSFRRWVLRLLVVLAILTGMQGVLAIVKTA